MTPEHLRIVKSANYCHLNEKTGRRERVGQIGVQTSRFGTFIKFVGHFNNQAEARRAAIELKRMVYGLLGLKTVGCSLPNYWLVSRALAV